MAWALYPICDDCANGVGQECHTPDCSLWMRSTPDGGVVKAFARIDGAVAESAATDGWDEDLDSDKAHERRVVAREDWWELNHGDDGESRG